MQYTNESFDNNSGSYGKHNDYQIKTSNGMATASIILGIIAIISCCCVYTTLVLAPIGIILAILSRGGQRKFSIPAKIGLGLCIGSYVILIIVIIYSLVSLSLQYGSLENFMNYYMNDLEYFTSYYGTLYK